MDTRSVSRRTRTTRLSPSAASSPSFAEDYLDIDHWPQRWRIEPGDLLPGQRLLDIFKPFLYSLLDQGLSRKTLRLHRDHVCALGGEIIRQGPPCSRGNGFPSHVCTSSTSSSSARASGRFVVYGIDVPGATS